MNELVRQLGEEELETLFRLLDKLAAALEAGAAAPRQGP